MTTLTQNRQPAVPEMQLDFSTIESFVQNSLWMNACASIIVSARNKGLDAIVLKGAAMIIDGYAHANGRSMSDIDLLVRATDAGLWHTLLAECGFTPLPSSTTSFVREDLFPVIIDLHTSLRFIPPHLTDIVWNTARKVWYQETAYMLLPHEIDLLYQGLHCMITHGYGEIKWLRDMDALIRTYGKKIDWYAFLEYTRESRATVPLAALLFRLKTAFETPVPVAIIDDCSNYTSTLHAKLFAYILRHGSDGIPFFGHIAPMLLQQSTRAVLCTIVHKALPSADEMRARYDTKSLFGMLACYPVRLLMLSGKGIWAIFSSLRLLIGRM